MCFAPSTLGAGGPNQNTSRIQHQRNVNHILFMIAFRPDAGGALGGGGFDGPTEGAPLAALDAEGQYINSIYIYQ